MPNGDSNLGTGLATAAYDINGHTASFAEPLPSNLAYSPPPPEAARTASYAGMIPASVERLGSLSERVDAVHGGSDTKPPVITVDHTTEDFEFGPRYIHPNRGNDQPPRSVSAGALNGESNKETPPYPVFEKRSKTKHQGVSTKETPAVTRKEKRKYEFKNPSSGPAPYNPLTPVALMYTNMHAIMTARDLCIGVDNAIRQFEHLESNLINLTDIIRGVLNKHDISKGEADVLKMGHELDTVAAFVKASAEQARRQRQRAKDMMKEEDNARNVFVEIREEEEAAAAALVAAAAELNAAAADVKKEDAEVGNDADAEGGGVGLSGSD